jgi:hypothetical protein
MELFAMLKKATKNLRPSPTKPENNPKLFTELFLGLMLIIYNNEQQLLNLLSMMYKAEKKKEMTRLMTEKFYEMLIIKKNSV